MAEPISAALQLRESIDPAIQIRMRVNDKLDDIRIGGQDILVGVYEPGREAKTPGGILLPDKSRTEYRWQGVTGLVLKLGPLAYRTEKTEGWFDEQPKLGDWIMFDVKSSHPFLLGDQPCRFVACQYVLAVVARPDMVA